MSFVELQKNRANIHRCISHQGEKTSTVGEEIRGEACSSDTFEYDVVCFQNFQMNAARQSWMETLSQTLADCNSFRYYRVLYMCAENLSNIEISLVNECMMTTWTNLILYHFNINIGR